MTTEPPANAVEPTHPATGNENGEPPPGGGSAIWAPPTDALADEAVAAASCPGCGTPRASAGSFCPECGYLFPDETATIKEPAERVPQAGAVVVGRYEIGELIGQRGHVLRFQGRDLGSGGSPIPITIVRQAQPVPLPPPPSLFPEMELPLIDTAAVPASENTSAPTIDLDIAWPSVAWEKLVLARTSHLSLPRVLDAFSEDGFEYMILERPEGRSFWDAWEEVPPSWPARCAWLVRIAEALEQLHAAGAILEGLRPDIVVVTPTGQAVISDLTDLLPLPVPADAPVRGSLYSAPELCVGIGFVDARSDLYSFGAMVYALLLSRELTELDFEMPWVPRPFVERFADAHPLLSRLLARTFTREPDHRFPGNGRLTADPTGFQSLMETLAACAGSLGAVRLDVAVWSTTGVVRDGNEDAVAVLLAAESKLEESDDVAVIVLADGMGGMESGEVAAAMTVGSVRDYFLRHPPFDNLRGRASSAERPDYVRSVVEALQEANQAVYARSRQDLSHAGMGCTGEVVVIDGWRVAIGHVGDSRTYHVRQGKLTQITHDQTLVSQLVLLGQLTVEEAENHPQRSELQQAVGGRIDVYPDTYTLTLEVGDWLLVCSDGLSNLLRAPELLAVLQSAGSAEKAARRLINEAIVRGAFDNVSVAVVRAC